MHNNSFVKCEYVSASGVECNEYFQKDGGKFCPQYHRNVPNVENKETFISIQNTERAICYNMSMQDIEQHIKEIESRMEIFMQTEKTKLQTARAVRAEKFEKLSEEERKELRKYQVNGKSPEKKPAANKVDKATKFANKTGISRSDLLSMDVDELIKKYQKGKDDQSK